MADLPPLESFQQRLREIDEAMAQPDFFTDRRQAAELSREHQKLTRLLDLCSQHERLAEEIAGHRSIVADADFASEGDTELRELAEAELPAMEAELERRYHDILLAMLPPDPSDSRNTIIEIRAGAGGDEASLFAADLFRMYSRFAETQGWKTETLGMSESEAGGFKEVAFLVSGDDVYRTLKYESGVHRVQRIPVTETNGRIHTSTATVAVLPEAEEVDVEIDPTEIEVSIARASGPGGQGVNTTDSAVQILHKPSGMIVYCADERSQTKNRAKAMVVLRARLLEQKQREETEKYAADRRSQVGTGDRSERIRTYNFPQGRLTDHRINLTLYKLGEVMQGDLDDVIGALVSEHQAELLAELAESA